MVKNRILQANLQLHALEAPHYDEIHTEIFNPREQYRLYSGIRSAIDLIKCHERRALDVGCGTGNVSEKLLELGFEVIGLDISPEMLHQAEKKLSRYRSFKTFVGTIEDFSKTANPGFSMITAYSVLHHLPDCLSAIRIMSNLLRSGGVLYLDHEPVVRSKIIYKASYSSYKLMRKAFGSLRRLTSDSSVSHNLAPLPDFCYYWSDYWVHKGMNWKGIEKTIIDCGLTIEFKNDYTIDLGPPILYPITRQLQKSRLIVAVKSS